jgi:hypothetical protein
LFMDFILQRYAISLGVSDAVRIGPPRKANLNKCASARFHFSGKRVYQEPEFVLQFLTADKSVIVA